MKKMKIPKYKNLENIAAIALIPILGLCMALLYIGTTVLIIKEIITWLINL